MTSLFLSDIPNIAFDSFTAWFFYAITLSGLIYLKIKKPELHRPYSVCVTHTNSQTFTNTHVFFFLKNQDENRLFLCPQVPIILPVLVLVVAIFLVLAPIIDDPQIEYLYVTLFILSGAILYVPFIHYKLCPGLLNKVTVFLQLFLEVAPAEKNL